ncbi:MAG: tetratricopeptide repeat protein, partial [Terrimicrobiaceae bacterium]
PPDVKRDVSHARCFPAQNPPDCELEDGWEIASEEWFDRILRFFRNAVDEVAPGFRTWLSDRRQRAEAIRVYRTSRRPWESGAEGPGLHAEEDDVDREERPSRAVPKLTLDLARHARIAGWKVIRPVVRWQRRSSPSKVLVTYFGMGALLSLSVTTGLILGAHSARHMQEKQSANQPAGDAPEASRRGTRGYSGRITSVYGSSIPQGASAEQDRLTLAANLIKSGQLAAAMDAADRAAAARSGDPAAWHNAGVVALAAGDRGKARSHFRKALELAPQSQATIFNLAQVEFEEGQYEEAARLLGIFRQSDPGHRIAAFREEICGILLGREVALPEDALPEDSISGLCARAAMAWYGGDLAAAKTWVAKARAAGNSSRFETDLRLLDSRF